MAIKKLKLAKSVAANTEDADTFTPANGKKVNVIKFLGEAPFTKNVVVKLIWDYGGGSEEILWSIEGASEMLDLDSIIGDGVKKIAIALDNGEASAVIMSGFASLNVED